MEISYGNLPFKVVRTISFERTPVMDDSGTDYLFTRFRGNVLAIINPQQDPNDLNTSVGMAYAFDSVPRGDPVHVAQVNYRTVPPIDGLPPITDRTIRHWLTVPRRKLVISDGGNILLASPIDDRVCDAHNGPFIDVFSIETVLGQARTYIVNFQFTTFINECEFAEDKLYMLLSNRFSQTHTLDEDYNLTVITTGVAHFRSDIIHARLFNRPVVLFNPDLLRKQLFLPIPNGFKRNINFVRARPDSTVIDYEFADTQKPQQYVAGEAVNGTRIEVNYQEKIITEQDLLSSAINNAERFYNFKWIKKAADESGPDSHAKLADALDKLSSVLSKGKKKGKP